MRRLRLFAVFASMAVAIGLMGPAAMAQEPAGAGETYDLGFRWTMITWAGPEELTPAEAVTGTGAGEGGDDVSDIVTALYGYEDGAWLTYFPGAEDIPGVNSLEVIERGGAYWVAINVEGGAQWTIAPREISEIRLGALVSLTGAGSTLGAVSAAALEIAVDDWNSELESADSAYRIVLDIEDTSQNAANATLAVEELLDRGARIIVGPQSSGEVAAIGEMIDEAGAILVSHGSTASTLSGIFANVFRFVPTDVAEGRAMVDLIVHDGAETIVTAHRDDTGNAGLVASVSNYGEKEGLTVTDPLVYATDAENYDDLLADLAGAVDAASTDAGAENVVVYLAGFEEVADILAAASDVEGLDGVRWYGGDGSARATALVADAGSAMFAMAVGGYPNPLISLPDNFATEHGDLVARIVDIAGIEPDAFGLAAFDAANVLIEAALQVGDGDLRETFLAIADGYDGVTGTIDLTDDGDRATAPFEFWSVCDDGEGGAEWRLTATWAPGPGQDEPGIITASTCESPL